MTPPTVSTSLGAMSAAAALAGSQFLGPPMAQTPPSAKVQSSDSAPPRDPHSKHPTTYSMAPTQTKQDECWGALPCQAEASGRRSRGFWRRTWGTKGEAPWGPQAAAVTNWSKGISVFHNLYVCTGLMCCAADSAHFHNFGIYHSGRWGHQMASPPVRGDTDTGKGSRTGEQRDLTPFLCPQIWTSASPGSISATTPPSVPTLWAHTRATAAAAGSPNLDSKTSKRTPPVKVPGLAPGLTPNTHADITPPNEAPLCLCRDVLPRLDHALWYQERGEWP